MLLKTYTHSHASSLLRSAARLLCAGLVCAFVLLPAVAQGPNITYTLKSDLKNGLRFANSVAADSAGNIFITDIGSGTLYKETLNPDGTYTQTTIATGASQPFSVAIDSANNLYVADDAHTVYKETLSGGTYTESIVATTFTNAYSLAVDAAGDIFVLDAGTGSLYIEKLASGAYTKSTIAAGLNIPNNGSGTGGIAVDTAGNVYIADTGNSRALKETLGNGAYSQSVVMDSTTYQDNGHTIPPQGIAVDAAGDVILTNENDGIFKAVPAGATYTTSKLSLAAFGVGAGVDSHGTLYFANVDSVFVASANELAESSSAENFGSANLGTLAPAQTATFTFDVGGTLATVPYAVSTQGDLTLDFQPAATQAGNVCAAGKTYNRGDTCTVAATFSPTRPGVRYGAIVLLAPSGTPIATSYLQGIGIAPQVSFSPGMLTLSLGSTFSGYASADSSNDIIISGPSALVATKYSAYPYISTILSTSFATGYVGSNGFSGFNQGGTFGDGLVIDGAGNLVFADGYTAFAGNPPYQNASPGATSFSAFDLNPTLPIQTTGTQPNANRYGKAFLASIPMTNVVTPPYNNRPAIDGAGNLFFSDDDQNRLVEEQYIHGGYNNLVVVATGFNNPGDVVVDMVGALYIVDTGNNRIVKETPKGDGTYTQTIVDSSFAYPPGGLAIDRLGNLYVSLNNGARNMPVIKETIANGAYTQSTLALSVNSGLDVDPAGNVFAVQAGGSINSVQELDVSTAPSLTFQQTAVGATSSDSPQTVTIANNGNAPLTFSVPASGANPAITAGFTIAPSSTCPQLGSSSSSATLAPGASCTLNINFTPTQGGANNGTLTITDNHLGVTGSRQIIKLNGQATGTAPPSATLTPSTYNYGSVNTGSSASQTFTLTNTGASSITIASTALPNTLFTVSGTTCGTSLPASATCTYTIAFKPTAAGAQSTTFSVTDDAGTQSAALTGTGTQPTAPQAALTPAIASFGTVAVAAVSSPLTFTLTNAGTAALTVTSFSITGANSSSFSMGTSTCGATVAAGASCTIAVSFAPTAVGTLTATLSVTDAVGTQTASLSGTAAAAPAPQAALTPATANFGSVVTGVTSTAQTFTLTNSGTAALAISSVSLAGTNAAAFAITSTCATSLAAGSSCTLSVTFTPIAVGSATATLTIADNAAGSPQISSLTGTGTAPAAADFSITATPALQSVVAGSTATYSVSVASMGGTFAQAVALTATGLPPGAAVTFAPASVTPGSSAAQSTMNILTAAQHAYGNGEPPWRPFAAPGLALALLFVPFRSRRRIIRGLASALLLIGIAGTISGCGGGFALPSSTPTTYTITVTGTSGPDTHTTTVTLTVR